MSLLFIKKHVIIIYWDRQEGLRLSSIGIEYNVLLELIEEKKIYSLEEDCEVIKQRERKTLKQNTMIYKENNKLYVRDEINNLSRLI